MASLIQMRNRIEHRRPHLGIASGDIASFTTDMRSPLKELKVHFYCQQAGTGTPSPQNIRPLSGWSSLDLFCYGKNLYNVSSASDIDTVISDGLTRYAYRLHMKGKTITFTGEPKQAGVLTSTYINIAALKNGNATIKQAFLNGSVEGNTVTHTFADDEEAILMANLAPNSFIEQISKYTIQIELGTTATEYTPFVGTKNSVLFPSEAGTVYGGYIDAIRGKLVAEWGGMRKKLSEALQTHYSGITDYRFNNCIPYGQIINTSRQMCNVAEYSWNLQEKLTNHFYGYHASSEERNRLLLFLLDGHGLSDDTYIEFAAPFNTPVEFDIDPITLKTLRGTNNIWSNANGITECTFWTH